MRNPYEQALGGALGGTLAQPAPLAGGLPAWGDFLRRQVTGGGPRTAVNPANAKGIGGFGAPLAAANPFAGDPFAADDLAADDRRGNRGNGKGGKKKRKRNNGGNDGGGGDVPVAPALPPWNPVGGAALNPFEGSFYDPRASYGAGADILGADAPIVEDETADDTADEAAPDDGAGNGKGNNNKGRGKRRNRR